MVQRHQQLGLGFFVETGGELVQQPANVFGGINKQLRLRLCGDDAFALVQGHRAQGMLQCPGNPGKGLKTHRGRTARQRMGQALCLLGQRFVVLQNPFAQHRQQAARPFVGLVEVHVVQLDPDAQRPDLASLLIWHLFGSGRSGLDQWHPRVGEGRLGANRVTGLCVRCSPTVGVQWRQVFQVQRYAIEHGWQFIGRVGRGRCIDISLNSRIQRRQIGFQSLGGRGFRGQFDRSVGLSRRRKIQIVQQGFRFGSSLRSTQFFRRKAFKGRGGCFFKLPLVKPVPRQRFWCFSRHLRNAVRCFCHLRLVLFLRFIDLNGDRGFGRAVVDFSFRLEGRCGIDDPFTLAGHFCRSMFRSQGITVHIGFAGIVSSRLVNRALCLGGSSSRLHFHFDADCVLRVLHQWQILRLVTAQFPPGFCALNEGLGAPMAVHVLANVIGPATKGPKAVPSQCQQVAFGGLLFRQHAIENLFERPGTLTKFGEPDHAGAAFECVKRTPQGGELLEVGGIVFQQTYRLETRAHDLAGLLKENVLQVVLIAIQVRRYRRRRLCSRGACALRQTHQRLGTGLGIFVHHRLGSIPGSLGHTGLLGQRCLVGQTVQLLAEVGQIHRALGIGHELMHTRTDFASLFGQGGRHDVSGAAHQRTQLTRFFVEYKQFLGQRRLVVQHIDQETQGAQVVAQGLECARLAGHRLIDLGVENLVHGLAHAVHRLNRLVQSQHRQHTAHLAQLGCCNVQAALFPWHAEELVQRFFRLAHGRLELAHHAAHGLAIAHPAVELLHPGIQWLGLGSLNHPIQALGQSLRALHETRIVRVKVFESRFQIQGGCGHFHGQLGAHHVAALSRRLLRGLHQRLRQRRAGGVQFDEGIGDQTKLVYHLADPVDIPPCEERPGLLGGANALARLGQQRGIKPAQGGHRIIEGPHLAQTERVANGNQQRRRDRTLHRSLGAEKQQVAQQNLGHFGIGFRLGHAGELQQNARGGALHIDITGQALLVDGLEEAGCHMPETAHTGLPSTRRQATTQTSQLLGGRGAVGLDQQQHQFVEHGPQPGLGLHGLGGRRRTQLLPCVVIGPEVGRVHTLGTRQGLHIAVLREQRQGLHRLVVEHGLQVFNQRKSGPFDRQGGLVGTDLRALNKALDCGLHGPQDLGRRSQSHHFQGAHSLVQLLTGQSQ